MSRAVGGMSRQERPVWWRPGLTPAQIASWEAAEECANQAPVVRRGDDVALRIQTLYAGFPAWLREYRAGREPKKPAA